MLNIFLGNNYIRRLFITGMLLLSIIVFIPEPLALASISDERVLEIKPVTDGLVFERRSVSIADQQTLIFILRADLTNEYLEIDTLLGSENSMDKNSSVTNMAVKSGAVAASNGDFFQMSESGRPIGMTYKDGEMVSSPPIRSDMPGWAITKDGKPLIEVFDFHGTVNAANGSTYKLSGINKPAYFHSGGKTSHEDTILLYNSYWGNNSRGKINEDDRVTEVFVTEGIVTEILENSPGKPIPTEGYVLAGRGTGAEYIRYNIKVGDRIVADYSVSPEGENIKAGTGGWSILVDGGQAMSNFPSDINGSNARTAVGISENLKNFYLIAVEKSATSRGMNLGELAGYMASLGINRGLNLDGGGSTAMAVRPLGDTQPVLINQPVKNTQRSIPTGIGFFSTAPAGYLNGLVITSPNQIFPGDSVQLKLKGYDSHYNPYALTSGEYAFAVESGPASIAGDIFTGINPGLATVEVNLNGLRAAKTINVLGSGDLKKITANPGIINIEPEQSIPIQITAVDKFSYEYRLEPKNYSVSLDPELGTFKDGVFTASETPGSGVIKITLGDYSVSIDVKVGKENQAFVDYSVGNVAVLNFDEIDLSFPANAFAQPGRIFAQKDIDLTELSERYRMISNLSLEVEGLNTGLKVPATLNWQLGEVEAEKLVVLQLLNGKWQQIASNYVPEEKRITSILWEIAPIALAEDNGLLVPFTDMAGHWSRDSVNKLAAAEIIQGYPGNRFEPDRKITRAEFVVMLGKALGWKSLTGQGNFKDSSSIQDWSLGYVLAASKRGVISGYEDNTFRPDKQVSRAEMAVMITNALSLPSSDNIKASQVFTDGRKIPYWAESQVSSALAAGIMKGDTNKNFLPLNIATRAENAAMFGSVLGYLLSRQ